MLNVAVIGIGNTGNQIAALAADKLKIPVAAINSSEKDLGTIPNSVPKFVISDADKTSRGAGKNRKLAQTYLKASVQNLVGSNAEFRNIFKGIELILVVSSTGGGTGSGASLIMSQILDDVYRNAKVIPIGVLPVETEAKSSHVNSLEYLTELYNVLPKTTTYMLYDNDRYADLPSYKINQTVNNEVIKDIEVLTCQHNSSTPYDSIDEEDMKRLISFPGRLALARLEDIKEKDIDIEGELIKRIKNNAHTDIQRDRKITATGIISDLSQYLSEEFNNHIPKVREFIGDPDHDFNHIIIHDDRKIMNNVYLIMAGLSPINDKIAKIKDRIDQIDESQQVREDESVLSDIDVAKLSSDITSKDAPKNESEDTSVNLKDIFGRFNL